MDEEQEEEEDSTYLLDHSLNISLPCLFLKKIQLKE